jgi:hypothetical protein
VGLACNHAQGATALCFMLASHIALMLFVSQDTRCAQAPSRTDSELGDDSFGWYTSEAIGVVVSLWTLLFGLITYSSSKFV